MKTTAALTALLVLGIEASPAWAGAPRLLAQRDHVQCPLPGQDTRTLIIDSASMWGSLLQPTEVQAVGRRVRWANERVLVHALAQQGSLGVAVKAAGLTRVPATGMSSLDLRISRPKPGTMAAMATSRPCVFVVLSRGPWQELQVAVTDVPQITLRQVSVTATKPMAGASPAVKALDPPSIELLKPAAPAASR